MKRDKHKSAARDEHMDSGAQLAPDNEAADSELRMIRERVQEMHKKETQGQNQTMVVDKIIVEIMNKNVYLNDFQEFPKVILDNQMGSFTFAHYLKHKKAKDVNGTRMEYFA